MDLTKVSLGRVKRVIAQGDLLDKKYQITVPREAEQQKWTEWTGLAEWTGRDSVFFRQAELLVRTLPLVHEETDFALKGGTAINYCDEAPQLREPIKDAARLKWRERPSTYE